MSTEPTTTITQPDQQLSLVACKQCGHPMELTRVGEYCSKDCYNRGYYRRNREAILAQRKERYATDPAYRNRIAIHTDAQAAMPFLDACDICGAPATDRHHTDDSRPTDVIPLCRSCHLKLHAQARKLAETGATTNAT